MAETIIGNNITVEGEITGNEAVTILGVVRGRVEVKDTVVVAQGGRVEADIDSQSVEVAGAVQGNVTATDKIDIKSGGRVVGDVKAPRVLIADGASFKGNINMQG
ncbi:MAG: bactofilin family protein [Myxococcota bacterium]